MLNPVIVSGESGGGGPLDGAGQVFDGRESVGVTDGEEEERRTRIRLE